MKTIKRIIKSTLYFVAFYLLENYLFSTLYCKVLGIANAKKIFKMLLASNKEFLDFSNDIVLGISVFQNILEIVAMAVLASFIFTYILNRDLRVKLGDQIVIRFRTSEGSKDQLNFCFFLINKSKYKLYDVKCTILCSYLKENKLLNGEYYKEKIQPVVYNYYRFSFKIEDFPKKFLEDYINKNLDSYDSDNLLITITGHTNFWGNNFRISKKYYLKDIMIGEYSENFKYDIYNPYNKRTIKRIVRWKELNKVQELSEEKREIIVRKIRKIIEMKENDK